MKSYLVCIDSILHIYFQDKLTYTSQGNSVDNTYFYVVPESGAILLIGDLTQDPQTSHVVSYLINSQTCIMKILKWLCQISCIW